MNRSIKPNSRLAWAIFIVVNLIAFIGIPLLLSIAWYYDYTTSGKFYWEAFILAVYSGYLASAWFKNLDFDWMGVGPNEIGTLMLGGKMPLLEFSATVVPALRPIFELKIDSAEPEKETLTVGKIDTTGPNHVNYKKLGVSEAAYRDDHLHMQASLDANITVIYKRVRGRHAEYLLNLGSETTLKKNLPELMRRGIGEEFRQRTPAIILNQRQEIDLGFKNFLQNMIDRQNWGLEIITAQMDDPILPPAIATLIEEKVLVNMRQYVQLVNARTASETKKIAARAQKYEDTRVGEGLAKRELSLAEVKAVTIKMLEEAEGLGRADKYRRIAKALGMSESDVFFQIESAREVLAKALPGADLNVIAANNPAMSGLLSFIPLLGEAIGKIKTDNK